MATVERHTSEVPIPVQQAQVISPSDFPFSYASAETMKEMGGLLKELGKRKIAIRDRQTLSNVKGIIEKAELDFTLKALETPLDKQSVLVKEYTSKAFENINKLKMSKEVRGDVDIYYKNWAEQYRIKTDINIIQSMSQGATVSLSADYEKALVEEQIPENIDAAEEMLDEHLSLTMSEGEAEVYKERIQQSALVAMAKNAVNDVHAAMEAGNFGIAKELAKSGLIPETQQTTLRSHIATAEESVGKKKELIQKQKDDEIGSKYVSLLKNKLTPLVPEQLTFDMISSNPDMSTDAKKQWYSTLMTFDNYSESELKEAFIDTGEVLAAIYDKIDEGTLTDELNTMVGKGLSPTTAERLKKEGREPFKLRTDKIFKNIFGYTPQLGFSKYTGNKAPFFYEKVHRDWLLTIDKEKATGEEIVEIGRKIARPYFRELLEDEFKGRKNIDIGRMIDLALGEVPKEPTVAPPITFRNRPVIKPEETLSVKELGAKEISAIFTIAKDNNISSKTLYEEIVKLKDLITPEEKVAAYKRIAAGEKAEDIQPEAKPEAAPKAEPETMPEPKTPAEYEALPSGTQYKHPDGSIRTKS